MKTRQNSLHPTYISTRKFEIKASQHEINLDLEEIIGSSAILTLPKKTKSQPFSPSDFPKRQKLKRSSKLSFNTPSMPDDALGILGFASFLMEAETPSLIPPPQKEIKKSKPAPRQIKKQTQAPKPQIKTNVTFMPRNIAMLINYPQTILMTQQLKLQPLNSRILPRSAIHLKIAFYINKSVKLEKSKNIQIVSEC